MHWKYDKIHVWCIIKSKLTTTRGEASYQYQKIKCAQVLVWWSTNLNLSGKHIFLADFYDTKMADCIDETKLDYEDWKKYPYINKPDSLLHSKWVALEEMVYTYFTAMKNIQGVPLVYFILKAIDPSGIVIDREQEIIKNDPL